MCDAWTIRKAVKDDAAIVIQLLQDMIAYHDMSHKYKGMSLQEFIQDCFGKHPWLYCVVVERKGEPSQNTKKTLVGFTAYHHTYNSKLGRGIYMTDLFVIPSERSKGIGQAMLQEIAKIAISRGCSHINWDISESNKRAINFYGRLGAKIDYQHSFTSLSGDALHRLSQGS